MDGLGSVLLVAPLTGIAGKSHDWWTFQQVLVVVFFWGGAIVLVI